MAKKKSTTERIVPKGMSVDPVKKLEPASVVPDVTLPQWLNNFKTQAIILILLSVIFYGNTIYNEYALDDYSLIIKNEYVLEGVSGIPDILTKDAFDSYYKQFNSGNELSGGRYRPLSIVTFALEQQFMGAVPKTKVDSVIGHSMTYQMKEPAEKIIIRNMHVRHFFNVLWFTLSMVVLLVFLRSIVFRDNPLVAFLTALLFTIHPIHTEVVANVKSRDEIMSFLFICLTFIFAFKYFERPKKKTSLAAALVCYALALLSKEYAIGLLVLLPLSFYLFHKFTVSRSILATLPYLGIAIMYGVLRLSVITPANSDVSTSNVHINPYALASSAEQLATKIATSLNYLKLLVLPHPLSSDYSYNAIPYKDFTHPLVWISILVHLGLLRSFLYFLRRRNVMAFAIAFYLVNLLLICNIFVNIGGTMGERLIYHSSLGFVMALAYLLYLAGARIRPLAVLRTAFAGFISAVVVLSGFKTIDRNKDWKNDKTLFKEDIKVVPNSFLVNSMVATDYINKSETEPDTARRTEDIRKGIELNGRAMSINTEYLLGYMNMVVAYYKLSQPDSMLLYLDKLKSLNPTYPQIAEMYYNAGALYFMNKQYAPASTAWRNTLKLKPDYAPALNAVQVLKRLGQY